MKGDAVEELRGFARFCEFVKYGSYGWTTEKPTEPGWYWAWRTEWLPEDEPEAIRVWGGGDNGIGMVGDVAADLDDFTHFLGPLPVPKPPEVEP